MGQYYIVYLRVDTGIQPEFVSQTRKMSEESSKMSTVELKTKSNKKYLRLSE